MHKRYIVFAVIVFAYLVFSYTSAVNVGLLKLPDSFFYYILGQYLHIGYWFPVSPFNMTVPQTLYGPVYGYLTYPLMILPHPAATIVIPFIQLIMIGLSSLCIYWIMSHTPYKKWAAATSVIFIFLPFNLLYGLLYMSEILTSFLLSIGMVFVTLILKKHKTSWIYTPLLVFVMSLSTLTRNAYLLMFGVSVIVWMISLYIGLRQKKYVPLVLVQLPAVIGIGFIGYWLNFNHTHQGLWNLTNYTGRHIYNNVVVAGKFLPPDTHPAMKPFITRNPDKTSMFKPVWDAELIFRRDFEEGKLTETQMDRLFLQVSIAAITSHPFEYAMHIVKMAFNMPMNAPYHRDILSRLGYYDPLCPECYRSTDCRFEWINTVCQPSGSWTPIRVFWTNMINMNRMLFPFVGLLLFFFSIVGSIVSLFKGPKILSVFALSYLLQHTLHSVSQWTEGRFLLSIYPLYAIEIIAGIRFLSIAIGKIKNHIV